MAFLTLFLEGIPSETVPTLATLCVAGMAIVLVTPSPETERYLRVLLVVTVVFVLWLFLIAWLKFRDDAGVTERFARGMMHFYLVFALGTLLYLIMWSGFNPHATIGPWLRTPEPDPFERFKKTAQHVLTLPDEDVEKVKEAVPPPKRRRARRKKR